MTSEDKELLFKDLCARLPYGINCEYQGKVHGIVGFNHGKVTIYEHFQSEPKFPFIEEVKPYLFPLSSINEEQKKEYCSLVWFNGLSRGWNSDDAIILDEVPMLTNFYHKNHIDYRGLIPLGLAIDATGLNIY